MHLMSRGFEVEFHDFETGGGFDFLTLSGGIQVEVECKHISADIGRKIHRRELYALGGLLHQSMERATDRSGSQGLFLTVALPGRLSRNKTEQRALAERIDFVLSGKAMEVNDQVCTLSSREFSLISSPFAHGRERTFDSVRRFLKEILGVDSSHVLSHWRPGKAAIVISFESRARDEVVRTIVTRLKEDAKKQFSGKQPACLCVHLADVTEAQLLELAKSERAGKVTALQRMASHLLQKRPYLHSIALVTDASVQRTQAQVGMNLTTSVREIGPSYVFWNPDHEMAGHPSIKGIF